MQLKKVHIANTQKSNTQNINLKEKVVDMEIELRNVKNSNFDQKRLIMEQNRHRVKNDD